MPKSSKESVQVTSGKRDPASKASESTPMETDTESDPILKDIMITVKTTMDTLGKNIEDSIKLSVNEALNTFKANFEQIINRRIQNVEMKIQTLETKVDDLSKQLANVDTTEHDNKMDDVNNKLCAIEDQMSEMESIRRIAKQSLIVANDADQYGRSRSIRIRGLSINDGEDCTRRVVEFIQNKLGMDEVTEGDIDVAHPVPRRRSMRQDQNGTLNSQQQDPIILVKFKSKSVRLGVISKRKNLRGTNITIEDDLTNLNHQLLNRLRNSKLFKSAWSWNGQIFVLLENGDKVLVKPFTSNDQILNKCVCKESAINDF